MKFYMTIDNQFVISWDFEFFLNGRGRYNFPKIRAIVLERQLKRLNFFWFWIFLKIFSKLQISIYRAAILCLNALILSDVLYWIL